MMTSITDHSSERIRQAARDGYLEILRHATKKECNSEDDDGMTATHWASYSGNLNALRIIVGRGGDPEKHDLFGNTALHWCAINGHLKCVSFLVSFGVNIWTMDNQYHNAKEVAALNNREEIVKLIDTFIAKQTIINPKQMQKLKDKAQTDMEKRLKQLKKLQNKTAKQAEKEEKKLLQQQLKNNNIIEQQQQQQQQECDSVNILSQCYSNSMTTSTALKFSDLVNSTIKAPSSNNRKLFSGLKVLARKQSNNNCTTIDTTINRLNIDLGTCRSTQSMFGIRRDEQIVYVPKFNSLSVSDLAARAKQQQQQQQPPPPISDNVEDGKSSRVPLKDVFNNNNNEKSKTTNTFNKNVKATLKNKIMKLNRFTNNNNNNNKMTKSNLYRTVSEPDFLNDHHHHNNNNSNEIQNSRTIICEAASIFERPGFGSVSFRGKFTPELMFSPSYRDYVYHSDSDHHEDEEFDPEDDYHQQNSNDNSMKNQIIDEDSSDFASDSIESIGSLTLLDEDNHNFNDESNNNNNNNNKTISVLLFLYSHGLKEYYDIFESEQIDIESLMLLNEKDLITLGIPLGPRRKLINAINQRQKILKNEREITFETRL